MKKLAGKFAGTMTAIFLSLFVFTSCHYQVAGMCRVADDVIGEGTLVMVYMAGANSLTAEVVNDLNSMELGLYNASDEAKLKFKIVALCDQKAGDANSTWDGCRLYEIQGGTTSSLTSKLIKKATNSKGTWRTDSEQEEDMGNINTLENFILWARETYPYYRHHALILWDHGNGIYSSYRYSNGAGSSPVQSSNLKSLCEDTETEGSMETNLNYILNLGEIMELLERLYPEDNKLEFLGFDACFMSMYEVAYEFRKCAKYMAASPANEYGGWNYRYIFSTDSTVNSGAEFAVNVVDGYRAAYEKSYPNNTMTAYDLSNMGALKTAIDRLAKQIYSEYAGKSLPGDRQDYVSILQKYARPYFNSTSEGQLYPYYDLGTVIDILTNSNSAVISRYGSSYYEAATVQAANTVKGLLQQTVLKTWIGQKFGNRYEANSHYGVSIFNSSKTYYKTKNSYYSANSVYDYPTQITGYGKIMAANTTSNGIVDTWKELQDAWYN